VLLSFLMEKISFSLSFSLILFLPPFILAGISLLSAWK
jgi:membrane-anchored glycerophosphoryl diester phosphodiesterase (GDPDase)